MWTQTRFFYLCIPADKSHFKMNTQGETNNNPILLEAETESKSNEEPSVDAPGTTTERFVPTEEMAMQAQRAFNAQRNALQQYNDQMNMKRAAAAVTPGEHDRKKKKIKLEDEDYIVMETKNDPKLTNTKVTIVETTKTIKDENGKITTVKTKEEITKPATTVPDPLSKSQSTLSVYGFTGPDADNAKVIPIFEAKVIKKKNYEAKKRKLAQTMKGLDYIAVHNDPLNQEVSKVVRESDVLFLNIKEVEDDESEPRYFMFDNVEPIRGMGREDETIPKKELRNTVVLFSSQVEFPRYLDTQW